MLFSFIMIAIDVVIVEIDCDRNKCAADIVRDKIDRKLTNCVLPLPTNTATEEGARFDPVIGPIL